MSKIPEVKDIQAIRVNLKKKQCLLESATAKKRQLKNEVMSLEAKKNSLMVTLQDQEEILHRKSEIQKELRKKLSNTEDQKLNTDLGSENVFYTIEKYKKKISELQIKQINSTIDNEPRHNIDEMEAQVEDLMSQVHGNSTLIDKLWNINSDD